jgi:hypothetical protein
MPAAAVLLQALALDASSVEQWCILCLQLGLSQQHMTGTAAAAAKAFFLGFAAAGLFSSMFKQLHCAWWLNFELA